MSDKTRTHLMYMAGDGRDKRVVPAGGQAEESGLGSCRHHLLSCFVEGKKTIVFLSSWNQTPGNYNEALKDVETFERNSGSWQARLRHLWYGSSRLTSWDTLLVPRGGSRWVATKLLHAISPFKTLFKRRHDPSAYWYASYASGSKY